MAEALRPREVTSSGENGKLLQRPRPYQVELFQQALLRNIVAYLDTGSGKTLVSVLLTQEYATELPKKVVFLVPTVPLVAQQAAKIRENTDLIVGEYSRDEIVSVAYWDTIGWYHEMSCRQVLVLTPQIFLNILRHGFLKLDRDVSLLVVDECHHAVKQHPYNVLMKEFYHTISPSSSRPKVFGMTASPIYQRVTTRNESFVRLKELQSNLGCVVVTVADRNTLQNYVPKAREVLVEYMESPRSTSADDGANSGGVDTPTPSMQYYDHWMQHVYSHVKRLESENKADLAEKLKRTIEQINTMKHELGFWLAGKAAEDTLRGAVDPRGRGALASRRQTTNPEQLNETLQEDPSPWLAAPALSAVTQKDVTPKVITLLRLLEERAHAAPEGGEVNFRAMIFVERRLSAKALSEFLNAVAAERFPIIKSSYVTGHGASTSKNSSGRSSMNNSHQKKSFDRFRNGEVNTLVVTRVAEEGVDIPACRLVVVFDIFRSHTGYVQSRGRARDLGGSEYLIMVQRNNFQALRTVARAKVAEVMTRSVAEELATHAPEGCDSEFDNDTTELLLGSSDQPLVTKAGASISAAGSLQVLRRYCAGISVKPYGYAYSFAFPPWTPLAGEVVHGHIRGTKKLAQQSVALATCRRLYEVGALNEHLLPNRNFKKKSGAFSLAALLARWRSGPKTILDKKSSYPTTSLHKTNELNGVISDGGEFYVTVLTFGEELEMYARGRYDDPFDSVLTDISSKDQQLTKTGLPSRRTLALLTRHPVPTLPLFTLWLNGDTPCKVPFDPSNDSQTDVTANYDANVLAKVNELLQQTVAYTPHNRMKYLVHHLVPDMHPSAEFTKQRYRGLITYAEYVRKLGYSVNHPESAMVEAHHSSSVRNLLKPMRQSPEHTSRKPRTANTVHLVPEACRVLPFPRETYRMASVFPSVLHKIDIYCLIDQFRRHIGLPHVQIQTLFAAFSAPSAQEETNYERLETLGDSFLKFAVSVDLFKTFPDNNEGDLSDRRSQIVCNRNLYGRAIELGLASLLNPSRTPKSRNHRTGATDVDDENASPYASQKGPGWRLISQKMLADFVEALIGAYYTDGGNDVAFHLLHKFGLTNNIDLPAPPLGLSQAKGKPSLPPSPIERRLQYRFRNRGLLREALTHSSIDLLNGEMSYQRLEFLGDAVLDWVVTRFFYNSYTSLSPAALTDLRQAAVNNESFARMAAALNLHTHLRHGSASLQEGINTYIKYLGTLDETAKPIQTALEGPKVLGDLFEAVAGAVFVDSGYDLSVMWMVFKPLMIQFLEIHANPDVVKKSPIRQFHEFFQKTGFAVNDVCYT
ncbi:hypothetical protein DFJ77DRAFT_429006 [Powellomyces hirtus]|nr:hypothetical protein DFJ77DRAFT_429006 [Powellomyces hirtus]